MLKSRHSFHLFSILLLIVLCFSACSQKQDEDNRHVVTSLQELKGHKLAILTGSVQDIKISAFCNEEDLTRLSSSTELLTAVENGVAEYTLFDEIAILNVNLSERGLMVAFNDESDGCAGDAAFAFNKNNSELCRQLNDFLKTIKDNGTLGEIIGRWSSKKIDTVPIPNIPQPKGKPIIVGTSGCDMPFSFIKDNQWAGIDIHFHHARRTYLSIPDDHVLHYLCSDRNIRHMDCDIRLLSQLGSLC